MKFLATPILCSVLLLSLAGCATKPVQTAYYDLGPLAQTGPVSCQLPPLQLSEISSPNWLSSDGMIYHLLYANVQQIQSFANHRWSMSPAQLMMQRLKSTFVQNHIPVVDPGLSNHEGWQLRLELDDFSQYFLDSSHSVARVGLRVSLVRNNRLVAQTSLRSEAAATQPNAPAGAAAMASASDTLLVGLNDWLCKQPRPL